MTHGKYIQYLFFMGGVNMILNFSNLKTDLEQVKPQTHLVHCM